MDAWGVVCIVFACWIFAAAIVAAALYSDSRRGSR